ncbi:MAG: hypothetical protein J6B16_05150 [Clostridia bacterium]|nr:hypothetical protein [Clostridia bacterium]
MADYIKCPRCELNYIHKDEEYCEVCKAELGIGPSLVFAVDKERVEKFKLCPICKQVEIPEDQEMCDKCRDNLDFKSDQIDPDNDEGWKDFVNDDRDDEEDADEMRKLDEEEIIEEDDSFDDEDEFAEACKEDDMEYVNPDDPDLLLDEDDEDEDLDDDNFDDED